MSGGAAPALFESGYCRGRCSSYQTEMKRESGDNKTPIVLKYVKAPQTKLKASL